VDSTNHKGVYEIQIDNSRFAVSGAKSLLVSIGGALGICDCDVVIPLTSVNPYVGTNFGLSCLPSANPGTSSGLPLVGSQIPNANAAASGGLPTVGTGSGQLNPSSGAMPVSGTVTVGTNNDKMGYTLDLTQPVPTSNPRRRWVMP
jgi:hypothetical protein